VVFKVRTEHQETGKSWKQYCNHLFQKL